MTDAANLDRDNLIGQIRYAERLCQRTARLYRRLQTCGTAGTVLAGSAAVSGATLHAPAAAPLVGAVLFAAFGAMLLAVRPAEKAIANETDANRYATLRADAHAMTTHELALALDKARQSDAQEVEPLRDVAYNDVVFERGSGHAAVPLRWTQRLLAALA